ncbi:hypothetical protein HME9302_01686 [Alteripontixanthobacter maritimus]|uniref:Uncharacterized protein n=1 Tax=Alteripontixanthobacter maritimus TaxID=2161824 RepID=A0A369QC37_9SPHN|nr:hypothetical protein HME9302_01686 [Alteripontixanthobacter maritimus]
MAGGRGFGKGKSGGVVIRRGRYFRGDFIGQRRAARDRVTIAEPPRQITVTAALGTEGMELSRARFLADRAGFGPGG